MHRRPYRNLEERLLYNSVYDPDTGCRIWIGRLNNKGYGRLNIRVAGEHFTVYAHRIAWVIRTEAKIPEGYTLDHTCENTACIEADHMELVTLQENTSRQWERRRREVQENA